jgi:hypothetical protein
MVSFGGAVRASSLLAALGGLFTATTAGPAGAAGGVRLVRSTSGTRGLQQGTRYVIEDPRTVFAAAEDRQVIVFFEWDGEIGLHHCEGRWKDPSGKVVLSAPVEYQATTRRFGIFWTLTLPETAAKGLWALEASVDGAPAGTHTFEVAASSASAPPVRRALSQAEIYQRALASVATVEGLGAGGQLLGQGPAVALDGEHLVTAFPTIEGASTLRVRTGSRRLELQEIGEWDRRQGWAVVPVPGHGLAALARGSGPLVVGDRCFVLDSVEDGGRVITEAGVVGQETSPVARLRLNAGFAAGSPVLDDRGDFVGIVAGPVAEEGPGPAGMQYAFAGPVRVPRGSLMVLADRLPAAPAARTNLADLAARGEFLAPLSPDQRLVISGVVAGRVQRVGSVMMPLDQRYVFARRDGELSVFMEWNQQTKKDVTSRLDLYDADRRLIGKGAPAKLRLRPGEFAFSTWTLAIARLPPGIYRVEVLLDEGPVWRGYVRITD